MKSYAFLFWAYNVIWIVLAGFLLTLVLKMRRVAERLDRLEDELSRIEHD